MCHAASLAVTNIGWVALLFLWMILYPEIDESNFGAVSRNLNVADGKTQPDILKKSYLQSEN